MLSTNEPSRDLLFGLLALQIGMIDQGQLVAAFAAWSRDKRRPIADQLVSRGDLDAEQRALLEALVGQHLKKHGGDTARSLAAVPADQITRGKLAGIGDPDIGYTLAQVGSASTQLDDELDRTTSFAAASAEDLGQRFRVLRPHARGGLGAVFVALDAELNREVALKQILDHQADDPTSRQRFLLEAEITGNLEHPGIVPVYGLGKYSDGRLYYAMRFIRGGNLKQAVERFHADLALKRGSTQRSLELRKLLRRFVDVCNAIGYAHGRGVLHRDIKPGNIIVGEYGETLVVDWGLAKTTGRSDGVNPGAERTLIPSSSSGSVDTLPGSALGTPGYMSPEQASGDLDRLGPPSDVYSLGTTLYHVLTGRPPFEGADLGEVLQQVQRGDFPPPRQIDRTIDRTLEAICLKAMALRPEGRYASSRALADDLDRWAADEPVTARREPAIERARRWARRHRTAVMTTAALLVTALITSTVAAALISREQLRTEGARNKAEAYFALARRAVDEQLTKVSDNILINQPGLQGLRSELLSSALAFYREFARLGSDDPRRSIELAAAYVKMGLITSQVATKPEALAFYRKALELLASPRALSRQDPALVRERATTLAGITTIHLETGNAADALKTALESFANYQELCHRKPVSFDDRIGLAQTGSFVAQTRAGLNHGDKLEPLKTYREELLSLASEQPDHEWLYTQIVRNDVSLAHAYERLEGNGAQAQSVYRRAIETVRTWMGKNPRSLQAKSEYGEICMYLGDSLVGRAAWSEAETVMRQAREVAFPLARANPTVADFQYQLAAIDYELAYALLNQNKLDESKALYREALDLFDRVAAENPDVRKYSAPGRAGVLGDLAVVFRTSGDSAAAEEALGEAVKLFEAEIPRDATNRFGNVFNLVTGLRALASLCAERGESTTSLEVGRRAQGLIAELRREAPKSAIGLKESARVEQALGEAHRIAGDMYAALEALEKAAANFDELRRDDQQNPELRSELGTCLLRLSAVQMALQKSNESALSWERARSLLANPRENNPAELFLLALLHAGHIPLAGADTLQADRDAEQCLIALGKAVSAGFRNVTPLLHDPAFEPLRRRAGFQTLTRRIGPAKPAKPTTPLGP